LAQKYGVCKATIGLVGRNRIWHDPNYHPPRQSRWLKIQSRIPCQLPAA
jgi:hypothetical protein